MRHGSHVLVVGGTGILRPAADALAARGQPVSALARRPRDERDAGRLVALDLATAGVADLEQALARSGHGEPQDALVYAPAAGVTLLAAIAGHVRGTVVHLLPSEHSAPDRDPAARRARTPAGSAGRCAVLDLGWHVDAGGRTRWHTPGEISAAAIDVLDGDAVDRMLGVVRPWGMRPR